MIIMNVRIDNFYCFKKFEMNMSYPKKIVHSTIEREHFVERPNFRYKKVNIIMGGNATGKTSFGKILMLFANCMEDGNYRRFIKAIDNKKKKASLTIDFVENNVMYRFCLDVIPNDKEEYSGDHIVAAVISTAIGLKDNYEMCSERLDEMEHSGEDAEFVDIDQINTRGWYFAYPMDAKGDDRYYTIENDPRYIRILKRILETLDPSIQDVIKLQDVENSYAIKMENRDIIIQDGKINDKEVLSSGTKAGLDISYVIASLICRLHAFYYCDELFSYVNSDVEKACLSIMIENLKGDKQLFFTTHNVEVLDMQLPKHSYTFLKKEVFCTDATIRCVNAANFLKRNTDSLRRAVENDLFLTAPDLDELFEISKL